MPSDQTVMEKGQVMFNCSATGNPVPNITWIKDGKTVGEGDVFSFEATRGHSGIYRCLADNGIEKNIEISFLINVQCKYRIKDSLHRYLRKKTEESQNQILALESNALSCYSTHPHGLHLLKMRLIFLILLILKYGCLFFQEAVLAFDQENFNLITDLPTLDSEPSNQTVTEGAKATLHCNATGNPAPSVRWIKDGKTVGNEDLLSFVTKRNDSGKYWCLAENGLSSTVTAMAYLDVQCKLFTNSSICYYSHLAYYPQKRRQLFSTYLFPRQQLILCSLILLIRLDYKKELLQISVNMIIIIEVSSFLAYFNITLEHFSIELCLNPFICKIWILILERNKSQEKCISPIDII